MPLLGVSLNAALLFLVPVSARPLKSRVLDPVAVPYAYLSLSQLNLTNPISSPNPPAEHVLCFNTKPSLNLTLVAEDCSTVLNDIILRLDEPYKKWPFSGQKYVTSHGPWIPSRWIVRQCTVFVNSARSASIDVFTLFEVAMTANKILSDCVTSDRKRQGGLMPIGLRELSYCVWLQGDGPGVDFNAINNAGTLAIPDFELSKRAQDAKRAVRGLTEIQLRTLDSSGALISLNEAVSPSNFTEDLNAKIDHEIDCFPARSILPDANADDCRFIINNIILGMKDPLREQTWGYTDTVDINLSLPESRWTFEDCFIQVKNLDERTVDRFRPVDVAEVAQNILQKCVTDTKKPLGGNADVGQLEFPLRFYVVLSGTLRGSGESVGNDTMLFHSSSGPRTLESRATLNSPEANPLRMIPTEGLTAGKRYPVHCFDPSSAHALMPAIRSDCDVIISEVILRLPNPMKEQSFGYTDAADINLSETEYNNWNYGQCVVFIRNIDHHTRQDRFRFLDVAYTAQRIMNQCLDGSKHAIGGIADVGTIDDNFYVGLSGFDSRSLRNGTSLELVSSPNISSPSIVTPVSRV